jgi:ATP-dependent Zn protease
MKLRTPQPAFERVKRSLFLVGLAVAMEFADPLPFFKSIGAWFIYLALLFEIVRQFIQFRLEYSNPAVARVEAYKKQWEVKRDRLDPVVRYRIRRFVIIGVAVFLYGQVISLFTDRCEGGFQCALLSLNLIVENIPMIFQVLVGIFFGLLQLALMFVAMTRVGFVKIVPPGTVDVTFDDVYGQDKARDKVREQVSLLDNDDEITEAGGYMPKGVLLTGPPGTGKTMLAKAAANASTKPLILIPPGAFAATFIGINFLKVWQLGRYIRKYSKRYGGVIVFFDEIDVLGHRGGEVEGGSSEPWWNPREEGCLSIDPVYPMVVTGNSGGMNMGTLEAFLSMMDGMEEPRGMVNKILALAGFKPLPPPKIRPFYLGATNRPSAIDPALKRAGRFGREIRVDFPKYDGRLATYQGYLSKVQHDLASDNIEWAARNHYRGTGAEIQDIVNEAVLASFRDPHTSKGVAAFRHLTDAMIAKRFGESDGPFENDANRRSVAIHEAGHALVMHALMRHRSRIWFASIEQRGKTGGMVAPSPLDDDWKEQHDEMVDRIAVSLASRVAEQKFNGQMSNGHGGDGPAATNAARNLVMLGHGDSIGFYGPDERPKEDWQEQIEAVLEEAYSIALSVIDEYPDELQALADLLYEEGTVIGDEIEKVFSSVA